jgi:hypothetical protein
MQLSGHCKVGHDLFLRALFRNVPPCSLVHTYHVPFRNSIHPGRRVPADVSEEHSDFVFKT